MTLKENLYPFYFKTVYSRLLSIRRRLLILQARKRRIRVSFIVSSLSMWKAQELYNLLLKDNRFEVYLVLCPFASFANSEKERSIIELRQFFHSKGVSFFDITEKASPQLFFQKMINPDIIFYPQPYYGLYQNGIDSEFNREKLLCYIPYGTDTTEAPWLYNQRFCNFAWRLYYASPLDIRSAQKYADNKGKNVRIVGNVIATSFLEGSPIDVWKAQISNCKRIIWAPHYSIIDGFFHQSSFLLLHQFMLDLAEKYKGVLQFAFKPHPKLISMLYQHPDWGPEKADAYYNKWKDGENTQLETGGYIDLFRTSDAMVHDSVSFTADYLYTLKPVLFFTDDKERVSRDLNELGKCSLDAHYLGATKEAIISFIDEVVIKGNDPMHERRQDVLKSYLLPHEGESACINIYHDILQSFRLDQASQWRIL